MEDNSQLDDLNNSDDLDSSCATLEDQDIGSTEDALLLEDQTVRFVSDSKSSQSASRADEEQCKHVMVRLEDQMNNENLETLQKIFEEADEDGGGGLDLDEFRQAMIKTMAGKGDVPDDKELEIIFMKVDANCDGTVDWEEFCSYMLLENQLKDVMTSEDREMEFPHPAREIPSAHRDTIPRITYFPMMSHGTDDSGENNVGRYVSISKDGVLQFWSTDFHPLRTITHLGQEGKASKSIWVTDCVVLPNAKKIAVSSADREIAFYDCSANSYDKQFVLSCLEHCVLSMDYWSNPQNCNQGILLFGDVGGCVTCLKFSSVIGGLFDLSIGQSIPSVTFRRIPFPEVLLGRHPNVKVVQFNNLHEDWVRKVKYYPSLQCFISCATASNTSLYLGDVDRKKTSSVFRIRKGITSFDYCKEWNVIVTGGIDHHVRLWNPYVTSKATSVLKGHGTAVTHIIVNSDKGEIISAAQDKVIKIWDMRDLCCVQTIPSRSLLPGPHAISSIYFNPKTHCILVGTNQLSVIEGKSEEPSEEREVTSHFKPICAALYNDLFNQVVSCCHDSVVCVWSLETGEKIIQFSNAHDGAEITAMTFDPSKRRLVTGSRNGTVKIWNFNNGCCLRELGSVDSDEITGLLCSKQRIITVGWSRQVTVYKDCREEEEGEPRIWPNFHKDDILSIDLYRPNLVATASYDGDVKIWSLETGHVFCILNAKEYGGSLREKQVIPLELKERVSKNNAVYNAVMKAMEKSKQENEDEGSKKKRTSVPCRLGTESKRDTWMHAKAVNNLVTHDQEVHETDHDSTVDKVLFLQKREHAQHTATLLTAGSQGWVRAWSVFGGLLAEFVAANGDHESVLSMATDENNKLLVTGDTLGFIKVWDISSYCNQTNKQEAIPPAKNCWAALKKVLPPIGQDDKQQAPPLVTVFRAHLAPIVSLDFVENHHLILSASTDCSVRLWCDTGRYIGTFGQMTAWDLEKVMKGARKLPHDVQRIASPETLRTLKSPAVPKWRLAKHIIRIAQLAGRRGTDFSRAGAESPEFEGENQSIVDASLQDVLGRYYEPKTRHRLLQPPPKLRFNQNQIIVYSSLPCKELEQITEHKIPGVLKNAHIHRANASSTTMVRHKTQRAHSVKSQKPALNHANFGARASASPATSHGRRASVSLTPAHGARKSASPALISSQLANSLPVVGSKPSGNRGSAKNAGGFINGAKK